MPINWNLAGYVNPDIKITPDQVPLEAMVNTGDELQKRYDTSYENYTKTQEALRQMANSAHEEDRDVANQIMSRYEPELKKIAESGRFHDMRWQTQKLANEAANDYSLINERKKQILLQSEAIGKDPRWQLTKDKRLDEYLSSLPKLGYDSKTGIISNAAIAPYSAAADVSPIELSIKYGSIMKPKVYGYDNGSLQYIDMNGKITSNPMEAVQVNHIVDGKVERQLPADVIKKAVLGALESDPSMKAALERDYNYMAKKGELTGDPVQDAKIKQAYYTENYLKPAGVAGDLLKVDEITTKSNETMLGAGSALALAGSGLQDQEGLTYEPTSINVDGNKFQGKELSTVFQDVVKGDLSAKIGMFGVLNSEIDKLKKKGDNPEKVKFLENELDNLTKVTDFLEQHPEYKKDMVGKNVHLRFLRLQAIVKDSNLPEKEKKEILELKLPVRSPGVLGGNTDTELEDLFENAKSDYFRNIPMQAPDADNAKLRNALQGLDLNLNYFKIDPENLPEGVKPTDKVKIETYSTEPIGGGVDYIFGIRDEKGNFYEVEANKATGRSILNQITKYSNTEIGSKSEFKSFPATVERPTRFLDLIKAGKGRYYEFSNDEENKKPMWALEPTDEIRPNDVGGVRTYSIYRNGSLYPFPDNQGNVKTEFQSIFDIYKAAKFN